MRVALGVLALAAGALGTHAAPPAPLTPHLILDRTWIASSRGTVRILGDPAKIGPLIDGPHDGNFESYVSVARDASGKLRMWYDAQRDGTTHLAYSESTDGLRWSQPRMLNLASTGDRMRYASGVLPTADGKGWLIAWVGWTGNWVSESPDGLSWTPLTSTAPIEDQDDIVTLVRAGPRLVMIGKVNSGPGENFGGPLIRNIPWAGFRRLVGEAWSDDGGRTWTPTVRIFEPDAQDEGVTQFYGMGGVVKRGDVYVGFLRVLRDDVGTGIGYTVLAWSHDGIHWQRDRTPFLSPSPAPGWDHAMAWADSQVVDAGRTWIYYGGYAIDHKSDPFGSRSIGVATLPTDRYAGLRTRAGELVTKPVELGGALTLNGSGRFRVEVLQHRVVDRCAASGNAVALVPSCDRPLPKGRAKLHITMTNATLYGFSTRG